jgi:hypothetical protein
MRFPFSALMAVLVVVSVACKEDPTADGAGTPLLLQSDFAALNVTIGATGSFTSWVTDVRSNRIPASVTFTTCNAAIATVGIDTAYHPVPATSMRAVVTSVLPGTTCVTVASAGVPDTSVAVRVLQATPLVITTTATVPATPPGGTTGLVGATLNDTARVVGGFGSLAGTVTFTLYDSTQATCAASPRYTEVVTIPGTGAYVTSPGFVSDKVGTWRWKVVYSGNINNKSVSSACTATTGELVAIKAATTLTTTTIPVAPVNGASLSDSATLGGGAGTPTGMIIFRLFTPSAPTCAGTPIFADTVDVDAGAGTYGSRKFKSNAAGVWRWTAEYSGDAINDAKKTACDDEQVPL